MDDRFGLETAQAMARVSLSAEACRNLLTYVGLLRSWQRAKNLVSEQTLADVWSRHVADGLQLLPLIARWQDALRESAITDGPGHDDATRTGGVPLTGVDLGSGAGLPGAVVALATNGGWRTLDGHTDVRPVIRMHLVEANGRKAAFLRTVSRETGVPLDVHAVRIDDVGKNGEIAADVLTARALAPLPALVGLARPWLSQGASGFFHKGGEYARELAAWADADRYHVVDHVSVVDLKSRILQVQMKDAANPRPAS